ncbi:MAG TPA: phosphatase PAP2 family protein [Jatrophihabitans sp.]|nr:phosphatase PAP2 family protein [Jatrophihabitans sp.]
MTTANRSRMDAAGGYGRILGWLLLWAVLIWLAFVGLGYLLGHTLRHSGLVHQDGAVDRWFASHRHPFWNHVTKVATFGAETITVISLGLVAFVLLRWAIGRWRESFFLAISIIGEVVIFVSTTLLVDRHRPSVPHMDGAPPTSSFPSGHTAAAVSLYGSLAVIAWHSAKAGWLRTLATVAAVVLPIAVATSRLYRGMHYPTDVLAGALLSVCWLTVTSHLLLPDPPPAGASVRVPRGAGVR